MAEQTAASSPSLKRVEEDRGGLPFEFRSTHPLRYDNIKPDRFSWVADRSTDGGKTWEKDHLPIEARRIGPARSLGPLAPARNAPTAANTSKD